MRIAIMAMLAACGGSPRPAPAPAAPAAQPAAAATPADPVATATPAGTTRDQPPEIKLKLGHYKNAKRGIGAVVDLTHHEARLRFDGTTTTQRLDPINHSSDSVSYGPTIDRTTLRVSDGGRIELWVSGGDGAIVVERDGDADPL